MYICVKINYMKPLFITFFALFLASCTKTDSCFECSWRQSRYYTNSNIVCEQDANYDMFVAKETQYKDISKLDSFAFAEGKTIIGYCKFR